MTNSSNLSCSSDSDILIISSDEFNSNIPKAPNGAIFPKGLELFNRLQLLKEEGYSVDDKVKEWT